MAYSQVVKIDGDVNVVPSGTSGGVLSVSEVMSQSLHAAGSVLTPGAGAAICTLSAPPAGLYRVDIHRMAGGSGTPTLFNNGAFRTTSGLNFVLPSVAVLEIPYSFTMYIQANGTDDFSVNSVLAGSANITISASITATRIK